MSDENNAESEFNPSSREEKVEIEDIFGVSESIELDENEKDEIEDGGSEEKETGESDEAPEENDNDDEDQGEDDEPEKDDLQDRFNSLEKRQKDTTAAFHKANQANQKILEKVANGEDLTAEDLKSLVSETDSTPDGMQKLVSEVNDALPIAKAAFSQISGMSGEEIDVQIAAFNALAETDPILIKELQETPVAERAAFVIKRGGELKEVFETVKEHGGSVTAALADVGKVSTRKLNKARDEGRAEAEKEFKEKYKDYVVSSSSKTKPSGKAPAKPQPQALDTSAVQASDIF